jgi:chemotaxis protein methyltransferase CheR
MHLSRETFDDLRRLIHRLCGLVLGEDRAYLVRHRLGPLARATGCKSFEELRDRLRGPAGAALRDQVVEAITTAETSFFRDGHPFEAFSRHILPDLAARARLRPVQAAARPRVWCAGCSTGQEPYSLAMLVHEYLRAHPALGPRAGDSRVLASDVSARVLAEAAAGSYAKREVARGLTPAQVARYFVPHGRGWVLRDEVRRLVEFRRINLLEPPAGLGPFDAVFCRNVLIYFDEATRRRVCGAIEAVLADCGWLVLGAAENLYGISDRFLSVGLEGSLVYRKLPGRPT